VLKPDVHRLDNSVLLSFLPRNACFNYEDVIARSALVSQNQGAQWFVRNYYSVARSGLLDTEANRRATM